MDTFAGVFKRLGEGKTSTPLAWWARTRQQCSIQAPYIAHDFKKVVLGIVLSKIKSDMPEAHVLIYDQNFLVELLGDEGSQVDCGRGRSGASPATHESHDPAGFVRIVDLANMSPQSGESLTHLVNRERFDQVFITACPHCLEHQVRICVLRDGNNCGAPAKHLPDGTHNLNRKLPVFIKVDDAD